MNLIEQQLPEIQRNLGNAVPAEARIAAYSTWASLRFDNSTHDDQQISPLDRQEFMALMSDFAFIKIESDPTGAQVEIENSRGWGKTEENGYVRSGPVHITLTLPGYEPYDVTEQVHPKTSNPFSYTLKRK
jgi:hypothetical protein